MVYINTEGKIPKQGPLIMLPHGDNIPDIETYTYVRQMYPTEYSC